ncbi:hypothetical protein NC651_013759 [Populus alba x Populus x berolinensis]|nr:hypothetical protein NC651_013759 [Populus alba x Populus x berolinensis]
MRNDLRTFHPKSSILGVNRTIEVIQTKTKRQPSMIVQSSPRKHELGAWKIGIVGSPSMESADTEHMGLVSCRWHYFLKSSESGQKKHDTVTAKPMPPFTM